MRAWNQIARDRAVERINALTTGYKPLPNIPDEFIGADGNPRPHWMRFLKSLTELGPDDISRRFATADRHIREAGVSYRAYGDTSAGHSDSVTYVVVDCPPSLNLLTVNALAAADAVLVPLQCEFFALEGLTQLLATVANVKSALNPALVVHGIVLTMHDARNNLSNQVVADVRANSKEKVYDTVIPRNVRVSEAPSYGKPVLVYDLKCVGSEAYLRLATEIIAREKELIAGAPPMVDAAADAEREHATMMKSP